MNIRRFFCSKIYYTTESKVKSFWHDIPLRTAQNYNMVIEIASGDQTIREMSIKEVNNPILIKKPKPLPPKTDYPIRVRDYSRDPVMNYGFFPHTYSSKDKIYRDLYSGDGDPLDVIEIGGPTCYKAGDIIEVKLIGSFCLIDQGEVDWKVIVTNITNKENIDHDRIKKVMKWFKIFKTFYGKKENTILEDKFFDVEESMKVIEECHQDYINFIKTLKI
jgi:inorganic pyrophosphatase